jgi:mono/diheme cytochrome c family protein
MEMSVRPFLKFGLIAIGLLGASSSLVHPFGPVKEQRSTAPLLAGAETNPEIARIFERSCQSCHSERTDWPWYSYVPPISWLIENDVHHGRSRMNLSRWDAYTADQQVEILTKIGVEVRNRQMPLPKYLRLHPLARLSDDEVQQIYAWAHSERRRVRTSIEPGPKTPTD